MWRRCSTTPLRARTSVSDPITIIGAGSGGCAAAADLTLRGWEVTLYNRTDARLEPLRGIGGLAFNDPQSQGIVRIHRMTSDLREALERAERVVLMVPTSTLGYYAEAMAPHLTKDHDLLLAPGHTGGAMFFARVVSNARGMRPGRIAEAHTLPYICRMTGPAEVTVWKRADHLAFAALPASETAEILETFRRVFESLSPASSVLETSLSNLNAVMHPGAVLLNAARIEGAEEFRFYSEGTTPAVGRLIAETDRERLAIGAALGLELQPFLEIFHREGYTTDEAWQSQDTYRAVKESPPNQVIKAPTSLDHRYVREDTGYGLVPMAAFGAAAGVKAQTMESLVHLASVATGEDLATEGLTATRLGIDGLDAEGLRRYALTGTRV
jgi:opine dehydrogenase